MCDIYLVSSGGRKCVTSIWLVSSGGRKCVTSG